MSEAMTEEERRRRRKKIESVRCLSENIHKLRRRVTLDLDDANEKKALAALAVAIMDKTAGRVGNESSALKGHFGVTGLEKRHVKVNGAKVKLNYVGKSGVEQEKEFTNEKIANLLKKCLSRCSNSRDPVLVTQDGFKIKADKINRYLNEFGITAKDIRGYSANKLMLDALKNAKISSDEKERQKKYREVVSMVAEKVGHQKATLKKHYLLPNIEEDYVKKGKVPTIKEAAIIERIACWPLRIAGSKSTLNFQENTYGENPDTIRIHKSISDWKSQRDYEIPSWDGIEKFHFNLAKRVRYLGIEVGDWYRYPSSERNGMDGINWRYVIPIDGNSKRKAACVNCHSLWHDGVWTLVATTYSTNDIDLENVKIFDGHEDLWLRSMQWSILLTYLLGPNSGEYKCDYSSIRDDMIKRVQAVPRMRRILNELRGPIGSLYEGIFGTESNIPEDLTVAMSEWLLPQNSIASVKKPTESFSKAILTISPRAYGKWDYIYEIIKHELIHAAIGDTAEDSVGGHDWKFQFMADLVDIPVKYRD